MAHEAGKGDKQRPTNHDAFASNFQQVFGGKVQRGGWVQDRITGKLIPRSEYTPHRNALYQPLQIASVRGSL